MDDQIMYINNNDDQQNYPFFGSKLMVEKFEYYYFGANITYHNSYLLAKQLWVY